VPRLAPLSTELGSPWER